MSVPFCTVLAFDCLGSLSLDSLILWLSFEAKTTQVSLDENEDEFMVVVGYASEDDCANRYMMHTLCAEMTFYSGVIWLLNWWIMASLSSCLSLVVDGLFEM